MNIISRVAVVGGTHGNETNGVFLARQLQRKNKKFATFETTHLIANSDAVKNNTRYVDQDLNRCFAIQNLKESPTDIESKRAKEIDQQLGPKGQEERNVDLIIDLHNTTANTGICLLMAPDDDICKEIAAHLYSIDNSVKVAFWAAKPRDNYAVLPSVAHRGMTFEVGPAPWGCIEPALYVQSLRLVYAALAYIDKLNQARGFGSPQHPLGPTQEIWLPVFTFYETIHFPRGDSDSLEVIIHPNFQGRDFQPLRLGDPIFLTLEDEQRIIHFDASIIDIVRWAGDEDGNFYPFFINEAAYYENRIAFKLARRDLQKVPIFGECSGVAESVPMLG